MIRTSRPIRYINQNLSTIIWSIIAIAIILLIIRTLNNAVKSNQKTTEKIYTVNEIQKIETDYVDQETLQNEIRSMNSSDLNSENIQEIISFINYCNSQDIDKAYDLISDTCKEVLFPTKDSFKNNYYSKIFNNKKTYNLAYISSDKNIKTYKMVILDDVMATGKYDETQVHEEFISIVEENGTKKLNISNFIKKEEINKTGTTDDLMITVNNRYIFSDCEMYSITAFYAEENYITLDPMEKRNTTYVLDSKDNKYYLDEYKTSYLDLQIYSFTSKNITLRFSKEYIEGSKIIGMNFTNILKGENTEEESIENLYIEFN